jgi:uroporphyrinogen-III synthase
MKTSLQQQIANELGDDVQFIEIYAQHDLLVFFTRNGVDYFAKMLKNGDLKKNSVRKTV